MGYTHYWDGTAVASPELLDQINSVITNSGIPLANWAGDAGTEPEISAKELRFNGLEDDRYETFAIEFGSSRGGFCKTGMAPYDEVVVAILILLDRACPDFSWSSDGNWQDHAAGRALANAVLRHG